MKFTRRTVRPGIPLLPFLVIALLSGCKADPKKDATTTDEAATTEPESPPVVSVITRSMEFIAPDTIPSGWNTFVYENRSTEPHFILLDKYPANKDLDSAKATVFPPFDEGMAQIIAGDMDQAMAAFGRIPAWYSEVVQTGGPAMVSPGKTAVTTVKLAPGYYVMECYVKMPDGSFHASMGMAKELIVSHEDSGIIPPNGAIDVDIRSQGGISWNGKPVAGTNIFRITHVDQMAHEHFMGHDVNLVSLDPEVDEEALVAWLNWATPDGLKSSTLPEGIVFLGGANDAPAGTVQYVEVDLVPGRYAFVAEVPDAKQKGMFRIFEVTQ